MGKHMGGGKRAGGAGGKHAGRGERTSGGETSARVEASTRAMAERAGQDPGPLDPYGPLPPGLQERIAAEAGADIYVAQDLFPELVAWHAPRP